MICHHPPPITDLTVALMTVQKSINTQLLITIAFGFLMTMSSGFGQTFFISLFNPELRESFDLSHGDIGGLYFIGTLLSAIVVIWLGKLIDQFDLRLYTGFVTFGLAAACLTIANVNSATSLVVAFFLLRLFGQGLSGHTGITTASRVGAEYRGRCVSFAGLGYSFGEIVLPICTIVLISAIGWRQTWMFYAGFVFIVVAVIAQVLLTQLNTQKHSTRTVVSDPNSWNRSQVIRDSRFWKIAPAIFSPPIFSTALFFHQQSLAESKNFTLSHWATGIAAYSIAAVLTSLATGILVDRFSGARLVRFYLLPMIIALLIAVFIEVNTLPFIYYALIGATVGIGTPSVSALWLELYGAEHIGAIRALTHACMVFGSALGPLIFGYLLDIGTNWNSLLLSSAFCMAMACVLLMSTRLVWTASSTDVAINSAGT